MAYYVYELQNENGKVEYVGTTKNPERRMSEHSSKKLQMKLIDSFHKKKFALLLEGELKIKHNIQWTEIIGTAKKKSNELLVNNIQFLLSDRECEELNRIILKEAYDKNIRPQSRSSFIRNLVLNEINKNI
jgi:predicted GIY-YIG superfamily endonuclease